MSSALDAALQPHLAAPARPTRPAGPMFPKRRQKEVKVKGWTLALFCVVVYLWLQHSFKLNIVSETIVIGLLAVLINEKPDYFPEPLKWHAAFLTWSLFTLPLSDDPSISWAAWMDALKILVITFLVLSTVTNKKQHRIFTLAWLALFAFYPVRGVMLNFITHQAISGRYGWNFTFANFNDLAALTLIPLALALDRLRTADKKWIKMSAFAGLMVLPFIVMITQSRGGLLGMCAFLIFLLARSRYRARLFVAIGFIAAAGVLFAPSSVWDRYEGMQHLASTDTDELDQADTSAGQRFIIMQVALAVIARNPLGVGIGDYPNVHRRMARTRAAFARARGGRDAHNTYLRVAAEGGLIGFGLFMMIFVSTWRGLTKLAAGVKGSTVPADRELADRCQSYKAAFVGLGVCALFGSLQMMVFPYLLVALCAATMRIYGKPAPQRVRRFKPIPQPTFQPRPIAR
ncbi:MAG: O-antigen ligase family protein [Gemmatimonadaceae bacterium]